MYEYYSPFRPLGAWIQNDVKGKFELNGSRLLTVERQSNKFIDKYELKEVGDITDNNGNIILDKFYAVYGIDKNKLRALGHSDRAIFTVIRDYGVEDAVQEIKDIINEG